MIPGRGSVWPTNPGYGPSASSGRASFSVHSLASAAEACLARSREAVALLARTGSFEGETPAGGGTAEIEVGGAVLFGGLIDVKAERACLAREADALEDEIGKIERKLANPRFVERAPEEVVEEQKARREEARARREQISRALGNLAA